MAFDVYQACPGGEDKKIKFCCGKDVVGDLSNVMESLRRGQRAAALGSVNQLIETRGEQACLLALKGATQLQLENYEELAKTAKTFLEKYPENPVAFSLSAIAAATSGECDAATDHLQRALERTGKGMHEITYEAIGIVAYRLLEEGDIIGARGHLMLQASLAPEDDDRPMRLLLELLASANVPLLLKQDTRLAPPPEGASWADAGNAVLERANAGAWKESCARYAALVAAQPTEASLYRNLAILQGWLGKKDASAESWHKCAAVDGLDLDDAIEAEAMAQLLSDAEDETVDRVVQTYPVSDAERVSEQLLSGRNVARMELDLMKLADENTPPPKGAFWLLDRPAPESGEGVEFKDVPNVLGEMYVYGRETDREARVDFVAVKTADFESKTSALKELLGEYGDAVEKEETLAKVPASAADLSWQWRLPDDVPMDRRAELIEEKRRDVNVNVWPETPSAQLDGKCPSEVAGDPAYRVRLLAEILLLELAGEQSRAEFDYNELREKLGLPAREDIDPDNVDIAQVSLVRLHLLPPEKLNDEDLTKAYSRAYMNGVPRAIRRLGSAVINRESLGEELDKTGVYEALSLVASSTDEALEYNDKARESAIAAERSPARWLFRELDLRMLRGEHDEFVRIMNTIQRNHMDEPGVEEAMRKVLVRIGAMTPDGQPTEAVREQQAQESAIITGEDAAPAGGGILLSDAPVPPEGDKDKPGLVLPDD